jgi:hypothetical protein
VAETPLAGPWAVLLYTDGIIEGRRRHSDERLGVEGLTERLGAGGLGPGAMDAEGIGTGGWEAGLEATLAWAEDEHGGPLPDDVALMLVSGAAGAADPAR